MRGPGAAVKRSTRNAIQQLIQCGAIVAGVLAALPAAAQVTAPLTTPTVPTVQPIEVRIVEWDLPPSLDFQAGAMMVDTHGHDNNRLWFVTRLGTAQPPPLPSQPARVVRFDPAKSLMKGDAKWTSWDLSEFPAAGFTGGLKKLKTSHDRRFIFVRSANNLQRIDTGRCDGPTKTPQTCERTVWADELGDNTSDVTIEDRNNVFTAYSPNNDPASSYIQMLRPGAPVDGALVTVKRWKAGATGTSGAGFCLNASSSGPCLSGIAVHPDYRTLVYFSEPAGNNIAELDIQSGRLRRWSLTQAGVSLQMDIREPRNLQIDRKGNVWVVTGSGHVVSLDPQSNDITAHQMPAGAPVSDDNDPYMVAPDDDLVGYTATGQSRVGMVIPSGRATCVYPTSSFPPVDFPKVPVKVDRATVQTGTASPVGKRVQGEITKKADGTFVEAIINANVGNPNDPDPSFFPLGMTPNKSKAEGTFFYGVGFSANVRVGFVRLPLKQKVKNARDDDDPDDGWDSEHNRPGHKHGEVDDDDDDGFYNEDFDGPMTRENVQNSDPAVLGPGQSSSFSLTATPTSLAVIGKATSDNPVAQLVFELLDSVGRPVGSSVTAPGTATATLLLPSPGTYTARVRNVGLTSVSQTATLIVREPGNLLDPVEPPLGSIVLPAPVDPIDPWP